MQNVTRLKGSLDYCTNSIEMMTTDAVHDLWLRLFVNFGPPVEWWDRYPQAEAEPTNRRAN